MHFLLMVTVKEKNIQRHQRKFPFENSDLIDREERQFESGADLRTHGDL